MCASTAIIKRTIITVKNPAKLHLLADGGRILAKGICDGFKRIALDKFLLYECSVR
jgi:hypothetical protein